MNEAAIRSKIRELIDIMAAWPIAKSKDGDSKGGAYLSEAPERGEMVVDLLDQVRLQVKYCLFDLEATRRENAYLRKMLEEGPGR